MSKPIIPIAALLFALGCDEAKQAEAEADASLQANATIQAADFELATVVALVEREDVRDAESLEALINAEDSTIKVDVDSDGKRDFIQVHEVGEASVAAGAKVEVQAKADADGALQVTGEDGAVVRFEFRVVPSSVVVVDAEPAEVETVVIATMDVELDAAENQVIVEASYAPTVVVVAETEVEHVFVHHIELEHRHDHHVIVGMPFVAWVWIDFRPHYHGHFHLPPGHAKHMGLHWDGHGHWHHGPGHHGHVKFKGHGHGGPGGGPDKVHVKVHDSHGGGGKVQVKAKGGPSGGKVGVKAKGGGGGGGGGGAKGGGGGGKGKGGKH